MTDNAEVEYRLDGDAGSRRLKVPEWFKRLIDARDGGDSDRVRAESDNEPIQ